MFNELSLMHPTVSVEAVQLLLEGFVRSCVRARELGLEDLRLHERSIPNLYYVQLHNDYNIDTWLRDNRVSNDLRNRFREIVTSSPLVKDIETDQHERYHNSEFRKSLDRTTYQVWGLGAAYIFDTLSISFATHTEWEQSEVWVDHYYLDTELSEANEPRAVRHFSNSVHLNNHLTWWEECKRDSLQKSADLWQRRQEFFPNLEFCAEVENQLKNIGISKALTQIIDRLTTLNKYVSSHWKTGAFNYDDANEQTNLRISPESDKTLQKFGSLRKFTIPERGKAIFDLHIKAGDLRLHFYPDNNAQKIYIGYIGKHLRIASQD